LNGQQLLDGMREAYANFNSYSDVGIVESPNQPGPGLEFQTYFKRPLMYRFQWLSWPPYFGKDKPANENVVWTDGQNFQSSYFGQERENQSLSMMLAGATGVSSGSVLAIFKILAPEAVTGARRAWYKMSEIISVTEEAIADADCFHITGITENGEPIEVWLEKESFLVRRIKETLVLTEELRAKILAHQQTNENVERMKSSMQKTGLPAEAIEKAMARLSKAIKPGSSEYILDYRSVSVNEPVDDSFFTKLNP